MNTNIIILLLISTVPVFFLLLYFYYKDKEREPKKLVLKIFILGVLLLFPAVWIEQYLTEYLPNTAFFNAFFVAAVTEELLKYFIIMRFAFRSPAFNQVTDGMVYAIVVSLGFAAFENILYVKNFGYEIGIIRAFTAIPLHTFSAAIMGYFIGSSKFEEDKEKGKRIRLNGVFLAILLHGFYNFWLFTESYLMILSYLQVYMMWRLTYIYWKHSEEPDKKTVLTIRMILKYLYDKYSIISWFKIIIATLLLLLIALVTTASVVQLKQDALIYILGFDLLTGMLSYVLYNSATKNKVKNTSTL